MHPTSSRTAGGVSPASSPTIWKSSSGGSACASKSIRCRTSRRWRAKLQKREVDVVLALAPTADREQYLLFTKPYLHYVNVIVTRDDFGFVTGLRDLALERVGVVEGHSSQQLLVPRLSELQGDGLFRSARWADGGVDRKGRRTGGRHFSDRVQHPVSPDQQSQDRHSGGESAAAEGILRRRAQGLAGTGRASSTRCCCNISHEEQREISQKWLSVRYESKVDYRAIWTSLAVFSAILLAAVLWITAAQHDSARRCLRHAPRRRPRTAPRTSSWPA